MDPITAAIAGALGKLGESVINDAYNALKKAIAYKCGLNSDVLNAIENLEAKPTSTGRRETLKEEVDAAQILDDEQIVQAAKDLLKKLINESANSTVIKQNADDNAIQIGQVGGDVNIKR